MQASDGWDAFGEATRDQRRFAWTLGLSIAIHVLVLATGKGLPRQPVGTGYPVLTVGFTSPAPPPSPGSLAASRGAEALPPPPVPLLSAKPDLPARDLVRDKSRLPDRAPAGTSMQPATATPHQGPVAAVLPAAPGRDAHAEAAAGGVTARMVIGEGGRIQQILWRKLPALTSEQFERLEDILRTTTYAESMAGSTVTEIVDVRGLLGLPAVRGMSTERDEPNRYLSLP